MVDPELGLATLQDRTTLGAIAGMGAILARDAYSFLAKQIGFAKFYVWSIAADLFVQRKQAHTALGSILGFFADLALGALLGVFFAFFLLWTRGKNPTIKGLGIGIGAWLFLFGIMYHTLPVTKDLAPKDALSNLSALVGHAFFGLVMGLIGAKLLGLLHED